MQLAERLRYARQSSGLTLSQVKTRTGIGESSVSDFENGKREPSLSQLQALARTYVRSVAFFFDEGPVQQEIVSWRQQPAEGYQEIEAKFLRLCEQYHNLELWTKDKPGTKLPRAEHKTPKHFGYPDAEELAKEVHRFLQLGAHPASELTRVLSEIYGVKIFCLEFEPSGAAASTVSDTFGAAVLLNARNVRWRRNFDLAHELFHLLTWHLFSSDRTTQSVAENKEEELATCFARHLLMPVDAVRSAVNKRRNGDKIEDEALYDVAREFDVSVEALMWHLHMIYRRPEDVERTKGDIDRLKMLAPALEERQSDSPSLYPARYQALAVRALIHGEMAIGRFAEYLGISRGEALKRVEQERLRNGKTEVTLA